MLAPQSDDEIRPVVEGLRRLDPLLDVRWNPQSIMLSPGSYSALGEATRPTYDGRWEVIRFQTGSALDLTRGFTVICTVTAPIDVGGIRCMQSEGPYAPLGEWLVQLMRSADAANTATFEALRKKLWAQDDALEHAGDAEGAAMDAEALDRVHFAGVYAGGVGNWSGRGAAFSPTLPPTE